MKKFILIIAFLFSSIFADEDANSATLIVKVAGLRNAKGVVRVALYNNADTFASPTTYKSMSVSASEECSVTFKSIPYGNYAIALLHDENKNGKMDYRLITIPSEGFGFSNNPKVGLSAPGFNSVKFSVDSSEKTITITVKYM